MIYFWSVVCWSEAKTAVTVLRESQRAEKENGVIRTEEVERDALRLHSRTVVNFSKQARAFQAGGIISSHEIVLQTI